MRPLDPRTVATYLPGNMYQRYHRRQRPHNHALMRKTTNLSDRDYNHAHAVQELLLAYTVGHPAVVLLPQAAMTAFDWQPMTSYYCSVASLA